MFFLGKSSKRRKSGLLTALPSQALGLTLNWLFFARGDFQRATDALRRDIANSDRENKIVRRALNDRIMKVGVCNWFSFLDKGRECWLGWASSLGAMGTVQDTSACLVST